MRRGLRRLGGHPALGLLLALSAACGDGSSNNTVYVRLVDPSGMERLAVHADLAQDEEARRTGLKGHEPLPPGRGLLIVLPVEGEVCITNEQVSFAIDAIFASGDGFVVATETDIPAGQTTLLCHSNVRHILEVAAGQAAGVTVGDRLIVQT